MTELGTYVFFDGTCADAVRYYERTLGAKVEMLMRVGEAPKDQCPMPPGMDDKIMHARLTIDGHVLMASDWTCETPFEKPSGFSLSLSYPSTAEAQRVFNALADGGNVIMPMEKTFWAEAFGMVVDRFGMSWMVNGKVTV